MRHVLFYKVLTIPAFVWVLQLLYVAGALGLLAILTTKVHSNHARVVLQISSVVLMFIVNVVWRVALKRLKPEWF